MMMDLSKAYFQNIFTPSDSPLNKGENEIKKNFPDNEDALL